MPMGDTPGGPLRVEAGPVDKTVGVGERAADSNHELLARQRVAGTRPRDHAGDSEEARAIGHLDDVQASLARRLEGAVHTPSRAEPAEARKAEAAGVETAQHVARTVEMDEEERHAFGSGPLQGDEPLAYVLERRAEATAEEFDVVVERLGGGVEALVGHARSIAGRARRSAQSGSRRRRDGTARCPHSRDGRGRTARLWLRAAAGR